MELVINNNALWTKTFYLPGGLVVFERLVVLGRGRVEVRTLRVVVSKIIFKILKSIIFI